MKMSMKGMLLALGVAVLWSTAESSTPAWAATATAGAGPTISGLSDRTVVRGFLVGPLLFTVGDDATSADALVVTASSSNTALLPDANLLLGGSGSTRSLIAKTLNQATGTTTITVSVSDGTDTTTASFALTVLATTTYFLAEGATGPFFDTDILIGSPHPDLAPVTLTFLKDDGTTVVVNHGLLGPRSRTTIHVDDLAGLEATTFSVRIETLPGAELAVERTMRWGDSGMGPTPRRRRSAPRRGGSSPKARRGSSPRTSCWSIPSPRPTLRT